MGNGGIIFSIKSFVQKRPILTLILILGIFIGIIYFNIEVLHFTSNPEFCAKCHPREGTGPLAEVYTSGEKYPFQKWSSLLRLQWEARAGLLHKSKIERFIRSL